jgi:hypothetical protein
MVTENEQYQVVLKRHLDLEDQAKTLVANLKDISSFENVILFAKGLKNFRKEWEGMIAPAKEAADQAHQAICDMERKISEPLERAEKEILKPAIARFEQEQEKIRMETEARLKTETGFDIAVPKETRMEGVSYRTTYFAMVTDVKALIQGVIDGSVPADAVSPNMKALNQAARSFKDTLNWPGVEVKSERVVAIG